MEEHIKALFCRTILAVVIAVSLPVAHSWWGASLEAVGIEGPSAFVVLLSMYAWSALVAIGYFIVGGIIQYLYRRRLQVSFYYDVGVGLVLTTLGVWAGITPWYHKVSP